MSDLLIAGDCFHSIANLTTVRKTTINECILSRSAGSILLLIAIICFIINIYFLIYVRKTDQISFRDRNLVIGMFISSLCVIIISIPSVVTQCFLCRRLCSTIICNIEGFNSFFNGCITMYMLLALSLMRYLTAVNPLFSVKLQYKIKKYNLYLAILSFLLGSIWAIPPIFGLMSAYVPEGLGFHCGLNWFDRSLASRIYFFLIFFAVYFLPMTIIVYVNIYIKRTIHHLTHLNPMVFIEMRQMIDDEQVRRHVSLNKYSDETKRLRCLHEDNRFVIATAISLIIYLFAWTPYGIVALAQVFGDSFSLNNPWLMTICALLAKLSMVITPIIYTTMLKTPKMSVMV